MTKIDKININGQVIRDIDKNFLGEHMVSVDFVPIADTKYRNKQPLNNVKTLLRACSECNVTPSTAIGGIVEAYLRDIQNGVRPYSGLKRILTCNKKRYTRQ